MSSRVELPPKRVGDTVFLPSTGFDFTSQLSAGETLLTATVTASVYAGTDLSPSTIVSGAAAIAGNLVKQLFTGGVLGVIYEVVCRVTTSLGQTIQLVGYLAIIPDLI